MLWVMKTLLRGGMFSSKKGRKLTVILVVAFLLLVCIIREDDTDAVVKRRLNKLYAKYNLSLDDFGNTNFSGNYNYRLRNFGNGTRGVVTGDKLTSGIKHRVEVTNVKQGVVSFVQAQHGDGNMKKIAPKQKVKFVVKAKPLNASDIQVLNPHFQKGKRPAKEKAAVPVEEAVRPQPPPLKKGEKHKKEPKKKAFDNEENTESIRNKTKLETKNIQAKQKLETKNLQDEKKLENKSAKSEKKLENKNLQEPDTKKFVQKQSLKDFFKQNQANHLKEEQTQQLKENQAASFTDRQGRTLPKELYDLAPVVFDIVPKDFDSNIKNPCWMGDDQEVKCLPYFYIVGMPDSGSENLWQKIAKHPLVAETPMTGYHWWNRRRARDKADLLTSFQEYLKLGDQVVSELKKQKFDMVYGEHSTSLFWDNDWWESFYPNFKEAPKYTVADILAAVQPTVKLVVILSEPGTLVYNNYLITTKSSEASPDDFDGKLMNSIDIFDECMKKHKKRTCIYQKFQKKEETVRLKWGFLSQYFEDWLEVFPLTQIKILEKTSFESNCLVELPNVFSFLELERLTMKEVRQICQSKSIIYRHPPEASQPMNPSTLNLLTNYFAPYLDELDELLSKQSMRK